MGDRPALSGTADPAIDLAAPEAPERGAYGEEAVHPPRSMGSALGGRSGDVEAYLARAPKATRARLRALRRAIREAAPGSIESLSYGMPFYRFRGESGVRARLCYFGHRGEEVVFYTRPAFLADLSEEVGPYRTARSALHFRPGDPLPVGLVQKVVRHAVHLHRASGGP